MLTLRVCYSSCGKGKQIGICLTGEQDCNITTTLICETLRFIFVLGGDPLGGNASLSDFVDGHCAVQSSFAEPIDSQFLKTPQKMRSAYHQTPFQVFPSAGLSYIGKLWHLQKIY